MFYNGRLDQMENAIIRLKDRLSEAKDSHGKLVTEPGSSGTDDAG